MDDRYFRIRALARRIAENKRWMTGRSSRIGLSTMVVVTGAVLASCGSTSAATTPTAAGGGHAGTFEVTVSFTGATGVQGSLTTPTVGATCAQYATNALEWTIGLGPELGNPVVVDGVAINFLIGLPQSTFHGAGAYTGNVVSGLSVGLDSFAGTASTLTIKSDGSGNASFTNYIGTTSSADESGTMTWTCSG